MIHITGETERDRAEAFSIGAAHGLASAAKHSAEALRTEAELQSTPSWVAQVLLLNAEALEEAAARYHDAYDAYDTARRHGV